jgi:hypothetical protein
MRMRIDACLAVRVDTTTRARLERAAEARGVSLSAVVRQMLGEALTREPDSPATR